MVVEGAALASGSRYPLLAAMLEKVMVEAYLKALEARNDPLYCKACALEAHKAKKREIREAIAHARSC